MYTSRVTRLRDLILAACLASAYLASAYSCFAPSAVAQGQLQSWNNNSRERSQRLVSAAVTALTRNEVAHATELLQQASLADPSDAVPLAELGVAYLREGKYPEALEALIKSYQLNHLPETLLTTGFAYYLQRDYDAAIASWTKALERSPALPEAEGDIGFAYIRKGDFVKADESFRKVLAAKPNSQLAYQGLAVLNYLAGHFNAAKKAAEHAQSIQPYYPVVLLLAKLDFLQGDVASARRRVSEWQREIAGEGSSVRSMTFLGYPPQRDIYWDPFLNDNFDNGRFLLARAQVADGKSHKKHSPSAKFLDAQVAVKRAQASAPRDFYLTRELALIEMSSADYNGAAEHFAQAVQFCPSCAVDWLHLAKVQVAQNKNSEASYAVREYQRLCPDEKIAAAFYNIAKGEPSAIPILLPQDVPEKSKQGSESGF